jgi:hypothetical protein
LINEASGDAGDGGARAGSPQLTAFFTSAPMLTSSAAVNSFSAKAVGHRLVAVQRYRACASAAARTASISSRTASSRGKARPAHPYQ